MREDDHRRVRRAEHRDRGVLQRLAASFSGSSATSSGISRELWVVERSSVSPRPPGSRWPTPVAVPRSSMCHCRFCKTSPVAVVSKASTRSRRRSVIQSNGSATRARAQVSSGSSFGQWHRRCAGKTERPGSVEVFRGTCRPWCYSTRTATSRRGHRPRRPGQSRRCRCRSMPRSSSFPTAAMPAGPAPMTVHAYVIRVMYSQTRRWRSLLRSASRDSTSHAAAFAGSSPSTSGALASSDFPRPAAHRLVAGIEHAAQPVVAAGEGEAHRARRPATDAVAGEFDSAAAYFERMLEERQRRVGVEQLLLHGQRRPLRGYRQPGVRRLWRTRTGECRRATGPECGIRRGRARCARTAPRSDRAAPRRAARRWADPIPGRCRGIPRPAARASPAPSRGRGPVRPRRRRSGWAPERRRDFPMSMWAWHFPSPQRPGCCRSRRGSRSRSNSARTMRKLKPRCNSSARTYSAQLALSKTHTSPMVTASG